MDSGYSSVFPMPKTVFRQTCSVFSLGSEVPHRFTDPDTEMKDRPWLQNYPRQHKVIKSQRKTLPVLQDPREDYSILDIVRSNLGKDFSRFAVPVWLNEPLSFLQRLAEVMQYVELLESAAAEKDAVDRIAHIGAFVVAGLSPNFCRLSKPFNPLLLETFELERDGYRLVAEQVCHHPPISALHVEGPSFVMEATVSPSLSVDLKYFIPTGLTCHPGAKYKVTLKNRREEYIYEAPTCTIYNIFTGKRYMNITGQATIRCPQTGLSMNLNFDAGKGWHFKTLDVHVDGYIVQGKDKLRAVYGNWTHFFACCGVEIFESHYSAYQKLFKECMESHNGKKVPMFSDSRVLWVANHPLSEHEKQFRFTAFSLTLNETSPEMESILPPTDSRRRQDMRSYENGKEKEAEDWKHYLETEQRVRRRDETGQIPLWFRQTSDGHWAFTGDYWKREWSKSTEIFNV